MSTQQLAKRAQRIKEKGAIWALERAQALEAQGKEIIHLEIGELDFPTPEHVVGAGTAAMQNGRTGYGPTAGIPPLRQAIANHITATRHASISPENVLVTPGVKGALYVSIIGLVEAGDEVIIPDPGFPAYQSIIKFAGGTPIPLPLRVRNDFQPDIAELRALITPRTKMLLLNSPSNPTGAVLSQGLLAEIAGIAQQHDLWVISDEIYAQLTFTGRPAPSIWALPGMAERTILLDGFSKAYAMTGWRLGYGVFPKQLIDPFATMMVNDYSCLPLFIQDAGIAALCGVQDSVLTMRNELQARRDLIVPALNQIAGISCPTPAGAYYALMDISELEMDGWELADRLLDAGISLLPGSVFGNHGKQYLRLAFTVSQEKLQEAVQRIDQGIRRL